MSPNQSFADLMGRLQAGKDEAAAQVFQRFSGRLAALARARLEKTLQRKVDPEDVLQSVFRSFFVRHAAGEFQVANWESLWSILTVITVRKCANQAQHFHRARRNVRRETNPEPADGSTADLEFLARDPTPVEAAMLAETVEHIMRQLDEREREILSLSLQGESVPAISAKVGYSQRTVSRALQHIRMILLDLQERASESS